MTTVLLTVIGATIALLSLWVAISRTRVAAAERDAAETQAALLSVLAEYEAKLSDNPYYFLEHVDRYERARLCTSAAQPRVVNPGDVWPSECGTYWTYVNPQGTSFPERPEPARLLIFPPSTTQPYLRIQVLASVGSTTMARERTYSLDATSTFSVYSEDDIRLDALFRDPETSLSITGDMYTASRLYLPTDESTQINEGILFAEEGFLPPGAIEPSQLLRWFCNTMPVGSDPDPLNRPDGEPVPCASSPFGVEDIRALEPAPLRVQALYDDIARLENLACAPTGISATLQGSRLSEHLCLTPGAILYEFDDVYRLSPVTVPEEVEAFLLIPVVDESKPESPYQLIEVWTSTSPITYGGDCVIECNLPVLAAPDISAGRHAGAINFWTTNSGDHLGTFYAPHSGVIFTSHDVLVGLCGENFAVFSAECAESYNGRPVGTLTTLTLLAGNRQSPADIYVSGSLPVHTGGGSLRDARGLLGLVATRQLFIPYWARTPGGDLQIDASLLALGITADYGGGRFRGAISTLPAIVHPDPSTGNPINQGESLVVTGSVGGSAVDLSTNHFHQVVLQPDSRLLGDAPPYFPAFRGRWLLRTIADLSPVDVCGGVSCESFIQDPVAPEIEKIEE